MKWRIDDVPIFAAIVEQDGITGAAAHLGLAKSTVSTALTRLEQALGFRLFVRNSRSVRLTPDGETFYRQALLILEQVREADATAAGLNAEPVGRLQVAMPTAFAQEVVAPRLAEFAARYPNVDLEITVAGRAIELLRDGLDLAVVVGPLEDSDLVTRTLVGGDLTWVASPDYLASNDLGETLDDLRPHIRICEKRYGIPKMPVHVNGAPTQIDLMRGISHVNDPVVVRQAVIGGAGISVLPERYCRAAFDQGSLVPAAPHITFDYAASALSLVYSHRMLMSPRLRVFIDFLVEIVDDRPDP